MPITSPGPLVAPSTRRGPVPDAKIGSTVRSPQGLRRRRRGNEHHRRVVRGDDRNVPDATRWGERASFEPTIAVRAEVDAKVAKCSRRRGGILKRSIGFSSENVWWAKDSLFTLSGANVRLSYISAVYHPYSTFCTSAHALAHVHVHMSMLYAVYTTQTTTVIVQKVSAIYHPFR